MIVLKDGDSTRKMASHTSWPQRDTRDSATDRAYLPHILDTVLVQMTSGNP